MYSKVVVQAINCPALKRIDMENKFGQVFSLVLLSNSLIGAVPQYFGYRHMGKSFIETGNLDLELRF